MAGFLDFLGGAAQSVATTVERDRELQQMEAFQNRLRKQEMEDQIKKEKVRAQLERSNRAGTIQGGLLQSPTGEALALRYDDAGQNLAIASLGEIPGLREKNEREARLEETSAERKARLDEATIRERETRSVRNLQPRSSGGGRGRDPKPPTAAQIRAEENAAIAEAAASQGLIFNPTNRTMVRPSEDGEKSAPVSGEERQAIINQATLGKSQSNPLPVGPNSPEPEEGTWIRLPNGTVTQHRK